MNGNIYGVTASRDFFNGKVHTGIGYRYVDYTLPENQLNVPQNIAELTFHGNWLRKCLLLSIMKVHLKS